MGGYDYKGQNYPEVAKKPTEPSAKMTISGGKIVDNLYLAMLERAIGKIRNLERGASFLGLEKTAKLLEEIEKDLIQVQDNAHAG